MNPTRSDIVPHVHGSVEAGRWRVVIFKRRFARFGPWPATTAGPWMWFFDIGPLRICRRKARSS